MPNIDDVPTAAHISTILDSSHHCEGTCFTFAIKDPSRSFIERVICTPDSDLWIVYPVDVTGATDGGALLYVDCRLLITVLHGPRYRIWAMSLQGEFVAYMEAT